MFETGKYHCENCGNEETYSLIRYGSYFLTCYNCKHPGPATSAIAVLPMFKGEFKIIEVDNQMNELNLIGAGNIDDYREIIYTEANKGKILWLKYIGPPLA